MGAIYRKEIKSYFNSITGYLFIGLFIAFIGLYHYVYNYASGSATYAYALNGASLFFMFLIPILTMRIMSEESKQRTDQLLFTSPVSITDVVMGKFLAMFTLFMIVMAVSCIQPLIMTNYGTVNLAFSYVAIFGFILLGTSYLALGLFISTVSESQVFSAVITFAVILFTWLCDSIVSLFGTSSKTALIVFAVCLALIAVVTYIVMRNVIVSAAIFAITEVALAMLYILKPLALEGSLEKVFGWFSVMARYENFYYGIFSLADTVYYLSLIVLFIFLTVENVKKRRWE